MRTFDLINALLRPKGVQLKQMWRDAAARLEFVDSHKMNVYILQVMSILRQGYCSPKYLYFLLPGQEKPIRDPDGTRRKEVQVSHPTARAVSSAASRSSGNSRDPCGNPKRHMRRPPPGTSPFPPSPTPTLRRQGRHPETGGPPRPVRRRGRSGRSRERWRGRARGVEPGAAVLPPSRIERRSDEPGRTPPREAAA